MLKMIFGAVSFIIGFTMIIVAKAVRTSAVWMDDSFRWGGRNGNG